MLDSTLGSTDLFSITLFRVGAPRIELGLSGPKPDVLPVYYAPITCAPAVEIYHVWVFCLKDTRRTSVLYNHSACSISLQEALCALFSISTATTSICADKLISRETR